MYVAGVLLMISIAVGVGAATAVVFSWQSGRASTGTAGTGATMTGPAETSTREVSKLETTGTARAPEDTAVEPSSDPNADAKPKASFIHRADRGNSRGDYTYISDPSINGDPNAIVLASPTSGRGNKDSYKHNIGVWYEPVARRWAIFNQDLAPVPAGSTFEVVVPQASEKVLHEADILNTAGNYTYIDDPLTNGEPDAVLSVTQNWNPGGGRGVYNDHPVDTRYDAKLEQWAVYNRDGKSMPEGAAFNVAVSAGVEEPKSD